MGSTSYSCTWGPASENLTRFCSAEEANRAGGAGVSGPAQQGRRHTSVRQTAGGGGGGRLGPHKRALLGPSPCNRWSARHAVGPLTLEPELEDILPRCRARRRWPGSALSREAERDDESGTLTAISVVAAPASPWPGSRVYRAAGKNRGALIGLKSRFGLHTGCEDRKSTDTPGRVCSARRRHHLAAARRRAVAASCSGTFNIICKLSGER